MDLRSLGAGHRNAQSVRGGVVLVSLYSWTCITVGVAIARFIIGCIHKVNFGLDDGMALCGSMVYLGATISWHYAVNGGLGKHFSEVYPNDATYFKAAYAAQLLQIAAMAFAKLSSAFLVERVAPQSRKQRGFLFGMVGVWIVYSLFAFAFQCGLPNPWRFDPTKCAHGGPLFTIIILNMVSDVVLAGWIYPILRPLSMDRARRINVALLFGSRAIVPLAAGAQIWAATKLFQGNDPTWDAYYFTLLSQTVTSLSLIVASLPRIKRFLGAAGGGVNRPVIHDTEIALSTRRGSVSGSRAGNELKLIPSNSTKFTTTVISGRSKKKEKGKAQQEWQKFVSMGSKQDEHTSTSSLFDRHEDVICSNGVVRQQEVTVKIEDSDNPD